MRPVCLLAVALALVGAASMRATAASITEFQIPTTRAFPHELVMGPDGALWFAEGGGSKIGRRTVAGVITEPRFRKGLPDR